METNHRYQLQSLNLLQKTSNQTFYGKRRQSSYGLSTSLKIGKDTQSKECRKSNILRSAQKQYAEMKSQLTIKTIKDKLNQFFMKNALKNSSASMNLHNLQKEFNRKKSQSFRITAYRYPFRRKNYLNREQVSNQRALEDICQQFQVKELCIERRQSANDPKHYERLGLKRNFLKFHGEHKCFEKAVQFKGEKTQQKRAKLSASASKQKLEMVKDCSLQYSSDEPEWGQVEGWRKPREILQWSVFSNLEGSVN